MTTLPLTEARNRLSEIVDDVERTHERVTITRHGREAAVIISADDLEAMEETVDVLGSTEAVRQLAQSRTDIAEGDVYGADHVAAMLAERRRQG